jgi:hypothetical protein
MTGGDWRLLEQLMSEAFISVEWLPCSYNNKKCSSHHLHKFNLWRMSLTLSVLSQFYTYHCFHLLKHMQLHVPPGRSKRCTRNDKTATFNLIPSGVTSDLTLTVNCVLNRPSWPLLWGSPGIVLLISTGLAWAMQGVRLIVESVTFATTLVSLT